MSKLRITLVKSPIDKTKRQKETLRSLGFRRVHQSVEKEVNPQLLGMIRVVEHLIETENI